MGLGGWMIQEGFMLQAGQHQQHVIRRDIASLVGPEKAAPFYRAWLDNFVTKADVDALAGWGFNSSRLPIHYDILALPADQEPKTGSDTWHEDGFRRIGALADWARAGLVAAGAGVTLVARSLRTLQAVNLVDRDFDEPEANSAMWLVHQQRVSEAGRHFLAALDVQPNV
jgi:hypothetical protein